MTRDQALAALTVGLEVARDLVAAGNRCLVTGDMGIANTTASAALICAFTGADPAEATGRGTGIDAATYARKIDVVCRGLARHQPDPADPVGVLAAFGGFEHAALAGFILGAAALRVPVILDGVIAGAAALAAVALAPDAIAACFAGHRSAEPGHAVTLSYLGLRPLVDLGLRLGEGTGAVLALPLVQSAARALRDVATFDSAGVADKTLADRRDHGPVPAGAPPGGPPRRRRRRGSGRVPADPRPARRGRRGAAGVPEGRRLARGPGRGRPDPLGGAGLPARRLRRGLAGLRVHG